MAADKNFEVAIVGGGIAGLTLAIALHQRKIKVAIYEQAPKFGEIGAGVSFGPNAVEAMKVCDKGIYEAFEKIATHNQWKSKTNIWFDFLNAYDANPNDSSGHQETVFTLSNSLGQNGVHRANFLDEMVRLLPKDIANFGKRLKNISQDYSTDKLTVEFHDGTSAQADAVIGCDGIKSRVRQVMLGDNHPSARPVYTHKYAYRGLIPMEKAVEAIGEERARNACLHMGSGAHALTFPVKHGKELNLVAFAHNSDDWPDYTRLTLPARREDAFRDFEGFGPNIQALISLTRPELDKWAIFDLGDHPLPTYYKGRVCLSGDAAHATSPHHGAGAGAAIEDAAVLSELLCYEQVKGRDDLETVFATFDASRRASTQELVQSSRRCGELYEWRTDDVGKDFKRLEDELNERDKKIWETDVIKMCKDAKEDLAKRLK